MAISRKEIQNLLLSGSSHLHLIEGLPLGVTKFQVFLALKPLLKGKLYWQSLRNAYSMSDNLYSYREDIRQAFLSQEHGRDFLMTKKEINVINRLPDKIKIYRGASKVEIENEVFGVSWTLDKNIAKYFALQYGRNYDTASNQKVIIEREIESSKIIAYFNDRKEEEIIYNDNVHNFFQELTSFDE